MNFSYFKAKYYDSDLSVWLSVDPMADARSWVSPYNYCQNSPMNRIDPTGALDVEDGYTVDKNGNIQWVDNTGGDDFDVLYNKDKYDAGYRDYDEKGKGNKGLKVENTSIMEQLEQGTKVVRKDSEGYVTRTGQQRIAITGEESGATMASVFLFLANNSEAEWSFNYANVDGIKKYGIGTFGWDDQCPIAFTEDQIITGIHSHPRPGGSYQAELDSMFGDRANSKSRNYIQYVYMQESSRLFNNKAGKSSYIRHINGDPSRFINMGLK